MAEQKACTVLLVESEDSLRRVIAASLERLDLRVLETDSLSEALKMIASERLELLIIELDFPRKENCKLIDAFRQHHCEHRDAVVVTTTQRPSGAWRREYKPRATVYKPFDIRHLSKIITSIIEQERRKNAEMSVVDRARP